MRYFRITCDTPYCGTTMEDYHKAETKEEVEAVRDKFLQSKKSKVLEK